MKANKSFMVLYLIAWNSFLISLELVHFYYKINQDYLSEVIIKELLIYIKLNMFDLYFLYFCI